MVVFYLVSFALGGCAFALLYIVRPQDIFMKDGVYIGTYPLKIALLGGITGFIITYIAFKAVKTRISKNEIIYKAAIKLDEKEITITRPETCQVCNGTGARPGTSVSRCSVCNGTGTVRTVQNTILGRMQTTTTCTNCHGTGEVIKEPCDNCKGKGTVRKQVKLKVKIPAGIDDNQTVVLRNEGEPGEKGGPRGNLYITVRVKKSNIFTRQGNNVMCEIPITITQATLGAYLKIPMVDGSYEYFTIPEATQTGTKFTIKDKGFKSLNSASRGNFIFTVTVQTPKRLSKEQRELLEQLAKTMNEQPPVRKRGIFG